jgi:hypothetical protein
MQQLSEHTRTVLLPSITLVLFDYALNSNPISYNAWVVVCKHTFIRCLILGYKILSINARLMALIFVVM